MALSDAAAQALLVATVADTTDPTVRAAVAAQVPAWWAQWAAFAGVPAAGPSLQYLYSLRDAFLLVQSHARPGVNTTQAGDLTLNLSDIARRAGEQVLAVERQIAAAQTRLDGSAGAALGAITITAPSPAPCPWGPDASDPAYTGSPYRPSAVVQR